MFWGPYRSLVNDELLRVIAPDRLRGIWWGGYFRCLRDGFPVQQWEYLLTGTLNADLWFDMYLGSVMGAFGGDFNPIEAAVDEAVAAFAGAHPDQDRRVWLKIANRVGADAFMDAVWQKAAEIREDEARGRRLRNKAAAFQQLLNRRFPREGGAK